MKERPILMSAPMVRAILAGRKTQTRRVVKVDADEYEGVVTGTVAEEQHRIGMHSFWQAHGESVYVKCPYGAPGDRLWVRETFAADSRPARFRYRADVDPAKDGWRWTPAIHMPRAACRLVLEVIGVRVERLLDITVDDSLAEGTEWMRCPECHLACYGLPGWGHDDLQKTPIEAYWHLWDQINEERGFGRAKNPWVWVVEFRRAQ